MGYGDALKGDDELTIGDGEALKGVVKTLLSRFNDFRHSFCVLVALLV